MTESLGWRERRAERRAAKQHMAAVAAWQVEQDLLDRLAAAARAAAGLGAGAGAGIILKPGEVALWSGAASLVEPRRQPGQSGPEKQTIGARGRVVVTSGRVVFTGGNQVREWSFSKLVSLHSNPAYEHMLMAVTNRQKTSGVHVGAERGDEFCRFVKLGVAIAQYGATRLLAQTETESERHRATRP